MTDWIKAKPIAHRGLHDLKAGRPENSLAAVQAAVDHGYAIEVDLHPSRDGVPMVFHDKTLQRMTSESGEFRKRDVGELTGIRLGGSSDTIPTLEALLDLVDGQVGLVLELKSVPGGDEGFVAGVLECLHDYQGPVAIMSFFHKLLADARTLGATMPVGLTAHGGEKRFSVHEKALARYSPDFLSYGIEDMPNTFVADFRKTGKPVITWTIETPQQAEFSNQYADQITFEGFLP